MISFLFEGVTDVLDTSQRTKAGAHLVLELFLSAQVSSPLTELLTTRHARHRDTPITTEERCQLFKVFLSTIMVIPTQLSGFMERLC